MINTIFPVLHLVDAALGSLMSAGFRLTFWASTVAITSMWMYWRMSSQQKISKLSAEAAEVRRDLARYDGELRGIWLLVAHMFSISGKQLGLTLGPAVLASIPVLLVLVWVHGTYSYHFPISGATIEIRLTPADAVVKWEPAAAYDANGKNWKISWPSTGEKIRLFDARGMEIATIPPVAPETVLHKRKWWNTILANPAGYLPQETPITRLDLTLPEYEYLRFGPTWMRSWAFLFFFVLIIVSVLFKIVFRVK